MGSREKDQSDFDLETFVDLFDTAMSSDNPAVQRALKNLVLISAMVNAQNSDGLRKGPLRRVVDDIQMLNKRIGQLESAGAQRSTYNPSPGFTTGYQPQTVAGTGTWPQSGTSISGSSDGQVPYSVSSGIAKQHVNTASSINHVDVQVGSLLSKLEAK